MRPIDVEGLTTSVLAAEGCDDLPARVVHDPQLGKVIETYWQLEDDEIVAIMETKLVRLSILGGQPPVMMRVVRVGE